MAPRIIRSEASRSALPDAPQLEKSTRFSRRLCRMEPAAPPPPSREHDLPTKQLQSELALVLYSTPVPESPELDSGNSQTESTPPPHESSSEADSSDSDASSMFSGTTASDEAALCPTSLFQKLLHFPLVAVEEALNLPYLLFVWLDYALQRLYFTIIVLLAITLPVLFLASIFLFTFIRFVDTSTPASLSLPRIFIYLCAWRIWKDWSWKNFIRQGGFLVMWQTYIFISGLWDRYRVWAMEQV